MASHLGRPGVMAPSLHPHKTNTMGDSCCVQNLGNLSCLCWKASGGHQKVAGGWILERRLWEPKMEYKPQLSPCLLEPRFHGNGVPRHVYNLCHDLQQHLILNLLREARDPTRIFMDTSWVRNPRSCSPWPALDAEIQWSPYTIYFPKDTDHPQPPAPPKLCQGHS